MHMMHVCLCACNPGACMQASCPTLSACMLQFRYSPERKIHILDRLAWSEMFESFLANKFAAAKRFGLEVPDGLFLGAHSLPAGIL